MSRFAQQNTLDSMYLFSINHQSRIMWLKSSRSPKIFSRLMKVLQSLLHKSPSKISMSIIRLIIYNLSKIFQRSLIILHHLISFSSLMILNNLRRPQLNSSSKRFNSFSKLFHICICKTQMVISLSLISKRC